MARELATTLFLFALLVTRVSHAESELTNTAPEIYVKMVVKQHFADANEQELVLSDSLGWKMGVNKEQEVTNNFMLLPPETHNVTPHRSNPWHTMYVNNDTRCLDVNVPKERSYISHDTYCLYISHDTRCAQVALPQDRAYISHDTYVLGVPKEKGYISHDTYVLGVPKQEGYISHDTYVLGVPKEKGYISHDTYCLKVKAPEQNGYISHDTYLLGIPQEKGYISHDTYCLKVKTPEQNGYISHDTYCLGVPKEKGYISHDRVPWCNVYMKPNMDEILIQPALVEHDNLHKIYVHPEMIMVTDEGLYYIDDNGTPRKISQVRSDEHGVFLLANL